MKLKHWIWLALMIPALAQADHHRSPAAHGAGASSPQQAAAIAKQRQPGKVLSVKRNNGFYKVKMLHEGKVRYMTIKAKP
ncbi:MAG: PepSY domain-containing protein [Cellvibrionaceae bacterium]